MSIFKNGSGAELLLDGGFRGNTPITDCLSKVVAVILQRIRILEA